MSIIRNIKFLRIPSSTIRGLDNMPKKDVLVNQNTLIPEILIRLQLQVTFESECIFSIENIITKCGYTPQTGKGRSIDLFRQALIIIQNNNFISNVSFAPGTNFSNVRTSTLLTCIYNENLAVNDENKVINFCSIDIEDYQKMSSAASGSTLRNMINVYCYLMSKKLLSISIKRYGDQKEKTDLRPNSQDIDLMQKTKSKDLKYINLENIRKSDMYKFGYTFATYDTICSEVTEDCKKTLSKSTLTNILKQLVDLEILYYGNINDYLGVTTIKKPINIYAFTEHGFTKGLSLSYSKYQDENSSKYPEEGRSQLLKALRASFKRNEHHINLKECVEDVY